MKYSNYLGVIACITLIAACFLPWAHIASIQSTLTGFATPKTSFGKPGLLHTIVASISIVLFLIPTIWAKRTNVFLGAFNLAWAIRNFILLSQCELGECPEKKIGIYIALLASIVLFIMTLMPRVSIDRDKF
jgi:hypothetical protein